MLAGSQQSIVGSCGNHGTIRALDHSLLTTRYSPLYKLKELYELEQLNAGCYRVRQLHELYKLQQLKILTRTLKTCGYQLYELTMKLRITSYLAGALCLCGSGCYTDTVDSLSTFTFQLPVNMEFKWRNKQAPDTTVDRVNLMEYDVYRDNREDIRIAELFQVGYWIDTLVGNPGFEEAEFEFVEFHLQFVGESEQYPLGRYDNVSVRAYYKRPHIIAVPDSIARVISEAVKKNSEFDVIQRYSMPKSGPGTFPRIDGKVDLVIRLDVDA